MAKVQRVPRRTKEFTYEGEKFGMRHPVANDQYEISKMLSSYNRSIRNEIKTVMKENPSLTFDDAAKICQGDMAEMIVIQKKTAEMFCVDLVTKELIFGKDGDDPEEVPFEFLQAVWACYQGFSDQNFLAKDMRDVFGDEFVDANAVIPRPIINARIALLEALDAKQAHDARLKLGLISPFDEAKTGDGDDPLGSTTGVTTTSNSEDRSSSSQSSSTSLPRRFEPGSGESS